MIFMLFCAFEFAFSATRRTAGARLPVHVCPRSSARRRWGSSKRPRASSAIGRVLGGSQDGFHRQSGTSIRVQVNLARVHSTAPTWAACWAALNLVLRVRCRHRTLVLRARWSLLRPLPALATHELGCYFQTGTKPNGSPTLLLCFAAHHLCLSSLSLSSSRCHTLAVTVKSPRLAQRKLQLRSASEPCRRFPGRRRHHRPRRHL